MSQDLSNIMPKILARALLSLREKAVMPRLVNGDYSTQAAEKGTTIDVPIPTAQAVIDVAPSNVPPAGTGTTPDKVQVQLNNWKQNEPFYLTDTDMVEVDANAAFLPMNVGEAVKALANSVNASIHAEYKGIFGYVGTAATTPFGAGVGINDATAARKMLNRQLAPRTDRRVVVNFDAEENFLRLAQISDAEKIGSSDVKIEGEIGRKFGLDWYSEDAVATHTAGTGASYLVNGTAQALGDKTIVIDGGTGTFVVGDIITFAGHTQTYAVTAALGGVGTLSFYPGLKSVPADNAAITIKASHTVNLAFHRDAFAFATRPLVADTADFALGSRILSLQDPQTGLVLRLEVSRQHKRVAWEFDILWGVKLVRPELAVRIAG